LRKDKLALDRIEKLDSEGLFNVIAENEITMCGYGPVAVVIDACRSLGASKGEVVGYMTSGDVTGDFRQVVGYGGVLIK
jgi:AmmeMemoRadiSam system protein B